MIRLGQFWAELTSKRTSNNRRDTAVFGQSGQRVGVSHFFQRGPLPAAHQTEAGNVRNRTGQCSSDLQTLESNHPGCREPGHHPASVRGNARNLEAVGLEAALVPNDAKQLTSVFTLTTSFPCICVSVWYALTWMWVSRQCVHHLCFIFFYLPPYNLKHTDWLDWLARDPIISTIAN